MRDERSCCFECPKRQLGCRTNCEAWAIHEAAKAKKYAEKAERRAQRPDLRRQALNEKMRLKEWKTKGKIT
jgi:hypothetical protein